VVTVHVIAVDQLNAYDVLVTDEVVFTSAALQTYVNRGSRTMAEGASGESEDASSDESEDASEGPEDASDEPENVLDEPRGVAEEDQK
jgi:large subunit ribosomal protein L4